MRIAKLLKNPHDDLELSDKNLHLHLNGDTQISRDKVDRFDEDTTAAIGTIGFRSITIPEISAQAIASKIRGVDGIDLPLIKGFEEIQRKTLGTRLEVLSMLNRPRLEE